MVGCLFLAVTLLFAFLVYYNSIINFLNDYLTNASKTMREIMYLFVNILKEVKLAKKGCISNRKYLQGKFTRILRLIRSYV